MLDRRSVLRAAALAALATPLLTASGPRAGGATSPACTSRAPTDEAAIPAAVRSMWAFGSALWDERAGRPGNLGLSPFSLAVALGMTANGAAGRTHRELLTVLGSATDRELNRGLSALTEAVERLAGDGVTLAVANQLFGQEGVAWERRFADVLAQQYCAGAESVDFAGAAEAARAAVNAWAAARTLDRIPAILPPGSVDATTRLVLVNALFFKADWHEAFEPASTSDDDFHLADGSTVRVPTMHATQWAAGYAAGPGWESVRIPYVGERVAMTVVLPDRGRAVDVATLPEVLAAARPAGVELALPRWTFRSGGPLKRALAALGMPTAFDERRADLTRMTDRDLPLWIADVHQQVFVAVDEEGTEAAAVSAVSGDGITSEPVPEHRVVVDRPFAFVIHDVEHGTPLFVGRVEDPR